MIKATYKTKIEEGKDDRNQFGRSSKNSVHQIKKWVIMIFYDL